MQAGQGGVGGGGGAPSLYERHHMHVTNFSSMHHFS